MVGQTLFYNPRGRDQDQDELRGDSSVWKNRCFSRFPWNCAEGGGDSVRSRRRHDSYRSRFCCHRNSLERRVVRVHIGYHGSGPGFRVEVGYDVDCICNGAEVSDRTSYYIFASA